uniref:G-protein coupled receptors family 3 profile domain-containing protein n=1 Tax=Anopheles atroparvus TaxID=41427 RepID=A0A182J9B7_ANOAO
MKLRDPEGHPAILIALSERVADIQGYRSVFYLLAVVLFVGSVNGANQLHIGGIFPIAGKGGWQGGQACMPAAKLALQDVNENPDLLPGFNLTLHSNDSECEPGLGASVMYNLLYNSPQKLMLLAGCSTVCTTVAEAAKMWNLVVTVEDLETRCKDAGIEIVTRQSFLSDPTDAVRNLRRQDARIIVGLFYVVAARRVLCEMYKQQLYGRAYVWFFIGWYEDNWYEVNLKNENISCTKEQMKMAAEGHLTTEALMWNQNNQKTISGMSSEDFRKRLNAALIAEGYDISHNRYPEGYQEAPLAYDAVWSVALAFNKTMQRFTEQNSGKNLKDFTYTDKETANAIYAAMNSTQFLGVSGVVAFSSQGDRIALTQIEQMIDGQYYKLGYYDTQADNLTWFDKEKWDGEKVPQDRTIVRRVLRTVSLPLFICMSTISCFGILVAIALIIFNIWHRHRRVIQTSHPVCNTIMLFGVIICLVSVILLGIDGQFITAENYPKVCQARAWILSTGFTMAYGAMFSKVWRVHRFTTKTKTDPKKKVEPWKLYTMVSGLLTVDLVILLTWQMQDPLQRRLEAFPLEDPISSNDDVKIRPELEHCESHNNSVWLGVIYGFKGLILVFGLFLAYETRSLKVKQINDSRYVGMSIYNVVVLCLITAPVAMVIASQQDASFAFVALAVIFCCFLSMLLIFVPKVIEVLRHPKDKAESKFSNDTGISKEDEERYQKLISENDDLQKLIAQKEDKIRLLKQRLTERETKNGGQTFNEPLNGNTVGGVQFNRSSSTTLAQK